MHQSKHGSLSKNTTITQSVGGIEFIATDATRAADQLISLACVGHAEHVHLANAYTIALADCDATYRDLLQQSSLVFPDGKPIGWISALVGHAPKLRQVRGPELFINVFAGSQGKNVRHYLLGSTPQVLEALVTNLQSRFPDATIVGAESPPFRPLTPPELEAQDDRIRGSEANVVWVGLGTPKQDFEARRLAQTVPVLAIAVGAAFDFAAGTLKEAPSWVSNLGLEWLFRLLMEPRRLWRRYVFGNSRFLRATLAHHLAYERDSASQRGGTS